MSDDLIKKEEAKEAVCKGCLKDWGLCHHHWDCPMLINLEILPSTEADVAPVKHGRWVFTDVKHVVTSLLEGDVPQTLTCSLCGFKHKFVDEYGYSCVWHYCPNCGARMDEVEE